MKNAAGTGSVLPSAWDEDGARRVQNQPASIPRHATSMATYRMLQKLVRSMKGQPLLAVAATFERHLLAALVRR